MKKLLALILSVALTLCLCACKGEAPDYNNLYTDFLSGETPFINVEGKKTYITDFDSFDDETAYALYDMNGDSNPKLIVNIRNELHIFTIVDNQIKLWRAETAVYSRPLNNGAILYERHGGGPEHTSYTYYAPDFYGNTKYEISFSYWESDGENPEWYDINGKEVSKEAYDAVTKPILSVGDDKIEWKLIKNKDEMLVNVLENKQSFTAEDGSTYTLTEFMNSVNGKLGFNPIKYTLIDLDEDLQKELIIEYFKTDSFFLIIDYSNSDDKLYGYDEVYRGLNPLKTDGRFYGSGGAAYGIIGKMDFIEGEKIITYLAEWDDIEKIYKINGKSVEKAEFDKYIKNFENTPNATWINFD